MSTSLHVYGFRAPDEKWKRMKAVYDSCRAAKIDPPKEVEKFFNYESPDPSGVVIALEQTPCCKKYREEMRDGFEIDLKLLPEGLTSIRFVVSC